MSSAIAEKLPPMLKQYLDYKQLYPDCLLLFQVGDFYEVFFEDAVTVSRTLNLTLTSRDKNNPNPVPMCGVPIAVVDGYLERLVNAGFAVALVSQTGAPENGRGMFGRKLERIVTPGVRILGDPENNTESLLAAVWFRSEQDIGISFSNIISGKIFVAEGLDISAMIAQLQRLQPAELLLPKHIDQKALDRRLAWVRKVEVLVRGGTLKFRNLDLSSKRRDISKIQGYLGIGTAAKNATKLLLDYVDETTVNSVVNFTELLNADAQSVLSIDANTRSSLELVQNQKDGSKRSTLYFVLDRTVTPSGSRMLRQWILNPLVDLKSIYERQQVVTFFKDHAALRGKLKETLRTITDLERIAARTEALATTPRELGALRDSLAKIPSIVEMLSTAKETPALERIMRGVVISESLCSRLEEALVDNPAMVLNEGGIIKVGFNAELDRLRGLKERGKSWIVELEASERSRTGINSLKIKYNSVFGYFIEVTAANLSKVPENYIRKQTTVNSERFITEELKKYEDDVLGAESRQIELEKRLYEDLRAAVLPFTAELRIVGARLAELDIYIGLAELAADEGYVLPQVDESERLFIEAGKHPLLAQSLHSDFVPNTTEMGDKNFLIITGPNMGGKSTFLKQTALIVIMAQLGSFVPAQKAEIGVVDKIFARIGASDDISEGESTFMVEMHEASHIISGATKRSLILIDEIGRGTATADGLAIAQAILEWIVLKIKSRTLFATHFHDLTTLEKQYQTIKNLSVGSVERGEDVIFTHHINIGAASKSYGIQVAKLAGLPQPLIERAKEVLLADSSAVKDRSSQLSLFEVPFKREITEPQDYRRLKDLEREIKQLDLNALAPLEVSVALSGIQKKCVA